jgi:predicted transcriptional regulator
VKTTTIRLDDAVVDMLDAAAEATGETPSDIMRRGILLALAQLAEDNDAFRRARERIVQAAVNAQTEATLRNLGVTQDKRDRRGR